MNRPNRKERITRERNHGIKEVAIAWVANRKCYIILKVTDGPCHGEIQEDWWEQRADCRSSMVVHLKIADVEGEPFMRSERHSCIKLEDALLPDGKTLRRPLPESVNSSSSDSHLWHFAGGIVFNGEMIPRPNRTAFCEYNSKTHQGAIVISFNGWSLFRLYHKVPHLLRNAEVFKKGEYDWLCRNW